MSLHIQRLELWTTKRKPRARTRGSSCEGRGVSTQSVANHVHENALKVLALDATRKRETREDLGRSHAHVVDELGAHALDELDGRALARLLVRRRLGLDVLVGEVAHVLLELAVTVVVVWRREALGQPRGLGEGHRRERAGRREEVLGLAVRDRADDVATVAVEDLGAVESKEGLGRVLARDLGVEQDVSATWNDRGVSNRAPP